MPPLTGSHVHVYESSWIELARNTNIKRISAVDEKGRTITFDRVQKDSSSMVRWYNVDYPVMDEIIPNHDMVTKYEAYYIVSFYPEGMAPKHVCNIATMSKCPDCPKFDLHKYIKRESEE